MAKAWTKLSLGGGGLQSASLALARHRKNRAVAYFWWLFFPLGAHALYLRSRGRALLYMGLTGALFALAALGLSRAALGVGVVMAILALYDLYWVDQRVTTVNKMIRMQVSLRPEQQTPKGYRGRYTDDGLEHYVQIKEQERGGHQAKATPPVPAERTGRAPSFAEQEAELRALTKKPK